MGYNKENYKRIREDYAAKGLRAQEAATARRTALWGEIPGLRALDERLATFGMRVMELTLKGGNPQAEMERLRAENAQLHRERRALLEKHGYPADCCEPKYECSLCNDSGYVGIRMCTCMRRALVEAGMQSSGMLSLLHKQSFENFSLDYYRSNEKHYQHMETTLRKLKAYAENFSTEGKAPQSLLFFGGTGLGKTHLCSAVARVIIERGYDVFYNSAVGMLSDFENRRFGNGLAGSGEDCTERYTECDLLIIDDLGTEVTNQFTLSCLYHVINTRLNAEKPMIVNTNLQLSDLHRVYSDRLFSRLSGEFAILPFLGTDIRLQKLEKR